MDAAAPTPPPFTFPPRPENVPPNLAKPSARYRFHAWLAVLGLCVFAGVYVALTGWFSWSAYRLLAEGFGPMGGLGPVLKGFGSAVIAVFLLKGLFFRRPGTGSKDFQVTAETQPRLFAFLHQVAKEAGAPRPHKVFLSPTVNAMVFYDLSLLNFLFPTRKNLEIGLSLVNVLTISEFKAVLAHEFGHFAQRSMAVGRWVYTAQQVAVQLIYHRDALDNVLGFISRIDLRIAWIGWLLRLVVWSIRSILDTLLSLVTLAERALSREMEFQADLVAVSTTGSDALIHGLYKLQAADQAWEAAKDFIVEELQKGHTTEDIFALQTRILEHHRRILNDEDFGKVPPLPEEGREQHRIFTPELAMPPQMWATHPQSHLREDNAKKTYVAAELDSRSAWEIFENPDELRRQLSAHLFEEMEQKQRSTHETLQALDASYQKEFFNPTYRGAYLGRSIVEHGRTVQELYLDADGVTRTQLYPECLTEDIEKQRNLREEKHMLEALRDRRYESPDGKIRFRGEIVKRSRLKSAIETVESELNRYTARLRDHDKRCRTYHRQIAHQFSPGWADHLQGLLTVLHYAEHSLRNLSDLHGKLDNTFSVVIADGNISSDEMSRLLGDAINLHSALSRIYTDKTSITLDTEILGKMKVASWEAKLEPFKLGLPSQETLGQWFEVMPSWYGQAMDGLSDLRAAALELLLVTEAKLAQHEEEGTTPEPAPFASRIPSGYATLIPGDERELQTKLNWWDSFQTASGPFAATTRFLISAALVFGAIYITVPEAWIEWLQSGQWRELWPMAMQWLQAQPWLEGFF